MFYEVNSFSFLLDILVSSSWLTYENKLISIMEVLIYEQKISGYFGYLITAITEFYKR
jgi:hypothetical protein